ncbi:hypothetical protein [Sphingobacterium multivorum]|uniref:hypothetical protein n=1 Tax=Sphingobacterium multivorum TaxID=28454 RepID=UPI003DA3F5F3
MEKSKNQTSEFIEVDKNEIIFFTDHWPIGFQRTVSDALKAKGINIDRVKVQRELTMIKKSYNKEVIETARFLLKAIKGKEYGVSK